MATITIPFPSKESLLGPDIARAASPPKISVKPPTKKASNSTTPKKQSFQAKSTSGVGKPKQTKSRNGCATCKEKRLKCDETKPHCEQCQRRNVECGGYNKIFQWRPEEKATFRANPASRIRRRSTTIKHPDPPPSSPAVSDTPDQSTSTNADSATPPKANTFPLDPEIDHNGYAQATSQLNFHPDNITPGPYEIPSLVDDAELPSSQDVGVDEVAVEPYVELPLDVINVPDFQLQSSDPTIDLPYKTGEPDALELWPDGIAELGQEIDLEDMGFLEDNVDMDVEEVVRQIGHHEGWMFDPLASSPSNDTSSSSSSSVRDISLRFKEPCLPPDSPEMLLSMFSRSTCGILSIKDGPTENPWRTLLLPLSAEAPALHHAILSMTAFHASRDDPRYRLAGIHHSQKSIQYLGNCLGTMRKDAALATTLVLAFSESWDQEVSTGMRHLQAARKLITQAIAHQSENADFDEMDRVKFLRNTWVYMDVIARVTAIDGDDLENLDALFTPIHGPDGLVQELDPLMGCASSFFPLLGRVANLVQEIRKTARISPRILSKAAGLRMEIFKWKPPSHLQQPEDESIELAHTVKTAEAYRWATLLFLYQAVPMIATETLAELAERILYDLVFVPTSSRLVIIHIFPLLVAGCEIVGDDNKLLVEERWMSMARRMTIGNLDRCMDVIHEVWHRRDALAQPRYESEDLAILSGDDDVDDPSGLGKRARTASSPAFQSGVVRPEQLRRLSTDHVAEIDPEVTIRGKCHWLTVMSDWNWAILLG